MKKYFLLYLIFLISFIIGEDTLGAAKRDFEDHYQHILEFKENFLETFKNFNNTGVRHSPVFLILSSLILKILSKDLFIFFIFNLNFFSIIILKKILDHKFNFLNENQTFILTLPLLLSPSFRSYSVWPDSYNFGLLFLLFSFYFLIKYNNKKRDIDIFYGVLSYTFASYISPNFALFSFIFFLNLLQNNNLKKIFKFVILNFVLASPAIYFLFFSGIDLFKFNTTVYGYSENIFSLNNLSNKLILIPPILVIHLLPLFILNGFSLKNFKKKITISSMFLLTIFFISNYFSYSEIDKFIAGGGITYKIYKYFFINNISFLILISFFSVVFLVFLNKKDCLLPLVLMVLSYPQMSIYHAYFEPLTYILIMTFIKIDQKKIEANKIFIIVILSLIYLIASLIIKNG